MGSGRVWWALGACAIFAACGSGNSTHPASPPNVVTHDSAVATTTTATVPPSLVALKRVLIPPKTKPRPQLSWEQAEKQLGFAVAPDVRAFFDAYGAGALGTLYFDDPRKPDAFIANADTELDAMHDSRGTSEDIPDPSPIPPYPTHGAGVMPIASNQDDGAIYLTVRDGVLDDSYIYVADDDGDPWRQYSGPLPAFVQQLAKGDGATSQIKELGGDPGHVWSPAGSDYYTKPAFKRDAGKVSYYYGALSASWDEVTKGTWGEWHITHLDRPPEIAGGVPARIEAAMHAAQAKMSGTPAALDAKVRSYPEGDCAKARESFGDDSLAHRGCLVLNAIALDAKSQLPASIAAPGFVRGETSTVSYGFRVGSTDITYWIRLTGDELGYIGGGSRG